MKLQIQSINLVPFLILMLNGTASCDEENLMNYDEHEGLIFGNLPYLTLQLRSG